MAVLYRHIRLDSNQPFYIGIGQDEKRAYSKRGRNKHWQRVVNKHGYKVQIMLDDLTWEEACQKEVEFIQLYGRADLGLGTLVNLTDGGDGTLGHICSAETKEKIGAWQKGKTLSEEHVAKLRKPNPKVSAALTGRTLSEEHKANLRKPKPKVSAALTGRTLSEEHIANLSAAGKGKPKPPRTAEHCANMSASKKAWWAKKRMENG